MPQPHNSSQTSAKFNFLFAMRTAFHEPQQRGINGSFYYLYDIILRIPLRVKRKISSWRVWSGSSQAPALHMPSGSTDLLLCQGAIPACTIPPQFWVLKHDLIILLSLLGVLLIERPLLHAQTLLLPWDAPVAAASGTSGVLSASGSAAVCCHWEERKEKKVRRK